jgi:hypothetical protein
VPGARVERACPAFQTGALTATASLAKLERCDERRAEPLDAIIRLSGKVAVIERDEMSALVSAVSGFFSVLAVTPIKSEHVLAAFPRPVLELNTEAAILKPLERRHRDLVTEAVPKLKPVERLHRSIRLVAKSVEGKAPDDSAVLRQNMKAERAAVDRRRAKDANVDEHAMMCLTVVEEFLTQKAIESRHVHVKCCQLRCSPPEFKYSIDAAQSGQEC